MKKLFTLTLALLAGTLLNAQTIPGAGFEVWHTANAAGFIHLQVPNDGWSTSDSLFIYYTQTYLDTSTVPDINDTGTKKYFQQVFPKGGGHTGTAAQLVTRYQDTDKLAFACLANCTIGFDIPAIIGGAAPLDAVTFSGGTDISAAAHRPASVGAWIKYIPVNGDTAHMKINVLNASDVVIGTVDTAITGTISNYIYIAPQIAYTTTTGYKRLQVIFSSSPMADGRGQDSSILYVDDVDMNLATGIKETNANTPAVRFAPNPSTGIVYLYSNINAKLSWQVFNTSGQVIVNKELATNNREDLSYLPAGTYFYNILNSKGELVQQDKFNIVK